MALHEYHNAIDDRKYIDADIREHKYDSSLSISEIEDTRDEKSDRYLACDKSKHAEWLRYSVYLHYETLLSLIHLIHVSQIAYADIVWSNDTESDKQSLSLSVSTWRR